MKVSEITKIEVKHIRNVFECLDKELELRDTQTDGFTEKELKKYHTKKTVNMIELSSSLAKLKHYEVSYEKTNRFLFDRFRQRPVIVKSLNQVAVTGSQKAQLFFRFHALCHGSHIETCGKEEDAFQNDALPFIFAVLLQQGTVDLDFIRQGVGDHAK